MSWLSSIGIDLCRPRSGGDGTVTLVTMSLSGTLTNGVSSSGTILGATPTSTIVSNVSGLTVNSGARTYAWDGTGAVGSTSNGLVETLVGATGSPKNTSITVVAAVTLATLSLSGTITNGTSSSGTITGASTGSTIVSNVTGLTVNSGARTYTWDGTGAAGTTSNGLVETLSGAIGSPKNSSITVAAEGVLTAPILTKTSTGGNSLAFSVTFDSSYVGKDFELQLAGASNYTTPLSGEGAIRTVQQIITSADVTDGPAFSILLSQPNGLTYARLRIRDDGGNISDWSNNVFTTVAASETASEWVATTGTNKSQYLATPTGTPKLSFAGPGGGFNNAPCSIRATQSRSGKRQFQVTINSSGTSFIWLGVDAGSTNFNSGFVRPGKDNSSGVTLRINAGDLEVWVGTSMVNSATQGGGAALVATGDVLTCEFDTTGGVVSFYRTRSGTTTLIYTTAASAISGAQYANAGDEGSTTWTAQFVTGQARTLTSGYTPYDN